MRFRQIFWQFLLILSIFSMLPLSVAHAQKITLGATRTALLVWVAEARGFFKDEGLDVKIELFQSGSFAADALIEQRVDLSTTSEAAFVSRSFKHSRLRILATLSSSETARLVGRKDRGITTPRDLVGKRIGVTQKSTSDFLLSRYLTLNGIDQASIKLVDLPPKDITNSLIKGEIDAGLTWEPFIHQAEVGLGDQSVILPNQEGQHFYFMLLTSADWVERNQTTAEKILRALTRAERFSTEQKRLAMAAINARFQLKAGYLERLWPQHNLHVSLPQDLLFILDEQARWRIQRKFVQAETAPNYISFIELRPLVAVSPVDVGIVR